jgi:hypothetical protein
MKTVIAYLKLFGAIVVLILVGEIPAVHALSDWVNANRSWLLPLTLGPTAAGLLVMIWGWIVVGVKYGRPMSEEEAKEFMARPIAGPGAQSISRGRFKGVARGRKVDPHVKWSFREMKEAWRGGVWWTDPEMRRKYLITAGGLTLVLGGFSVLGVIAEASSVKLLSAGTVIHTIVRTADGFRRA